MNDTTDAPEVCGAPKTDGRVAVTCILTEGHEGWHESDYVAEDEQSVRYPGARHQIRTTTHEHIEWEQFSVRRLTRSLRSAAAGPGTTGGDAT